MGDERTRIRRLIEGLELCEANGEMGVDAQHDVIYAGSLGFDEDDMEAMAEFGWHREDEFGCWGFFT
jgi:hypothetical protein